MINKYPRTLHLPFSPEIHSDDKVMNLKDVENILNQEYVILEKMDGQNNCLKGLNTNNGNYGGVFARTHTQETQLPWDSYLINWYHQNKYNLKVGDIIIAKDECVMIDDKKKALVIGKEYEISQIKDDYLIIEGELGEHFFEFKEFDDFMLNKNSVFKL